MQNETLAMFDLSLITSLYRAAPFLPAYRRSLLDVLQTLQVSRIKVEVILICNDPDEIEKDQIELLRLEIKSIAETQIVTVGRETLYASWNRGLKLFRGDSCGFWNVDDIHTANAYIEAVDAIRRDYTLIDFPYILVQRNLHGEQRQVQNILYRNGTHTRKSLFSTFSVLSRSLIETTGLFDEKFQIAGDLEYSVRTSETSRFYAGKEIGGEFYLHGENLSQPGNALQLVESNIVFLIRQQWDQLVPAHPGLMRKKWSAFGLSESDLPKDVQRWLWGRSALYRAYWNLLLWRYSILQRTYGWLVTRSLIPNILRFSGSGSV